MIVPQDPKRDLRLDASGPGTGLPIYWARWVGYDNQVGPWSLPCGTTTQKGAQALPEAAKSSTKSAGEQSLKLAA